MRDFVEASLDADDVAGIEEVGGLTEVGAAIVQAARNGMPLRTAIARASNGSLPASMGGRLVSPPFGRSTRNVERRAPLGFKDPSGNNSWALPAVLNSTIVMTAKVSREAHVDRLLIVPSAPGVVIESIKVGDEEQMLASGVPVELYGASALTDTLPDNFSPLGPALDFIVTLKNTTAGAITGTIGTKASCKR